MKLKHFMIFCILMICTTMTACGGTVNELGIREIENGNMVTFDLWGLVASTFEVNKITLTGENGSEFICSTSSGDASKEGVFLLDSYSGGTSVAVPSGSTIFWSDRDYGEDGMTTAQNDCIWLEFVNQKKHRILGYAVVRVDKVSDLVYEPTLIKSVTFPKLNWVTMEQVEQLMDEVEKNDAESE